MGSSGRHRRGNPCTAPGCDRLISRVRLGLCEAHYYRLRRTGSLGDEPIKNGRSECSVTGCTTLACSLGYCSQHYQRLRNNGSPEALRGPSAGERSPMWAGDDVGYHGVHQRLVKQRGKASEHVCPCGKPARQWSYRGPRTPGERMPFSPDLSLYEAMCVPCHKRADLAAITERVSVP